MNKQLHAAVLSALALIFSNTALAEHTETLNLDEVSVTAPLPDNPLAKAATTKTDTPLMETPMSVQVVPQQVLRDRAVTQTNQLLENVSGVHAESNYGGNAATFFNIRSFSTSNGLRDGFRNYGYIAYRDTQNIEQVEVLKGPAGALYGGLGSLDGQINTASKHPMPDCFGEASLLMGQFGQSRATFDVNTGEKKWICHATEWCVRTK